MAKYYTTTHSHPFSWEQVAAAYFRRYPNPLSSHVLSEDTVYRKLDEKNTDVLYTRRFLTKTNRLPTWAEKFVVGIRRFVPLVEESIVDRHNRVLVTYIRNVSLARFMSAVERVEYRQSSDGTNSVVAVKEAWVESGLVGIRSVVKNYGIERFKQNCHKATEGFNLVMSNLYATQDRVRQRMKESARIAKGRRTVFAREESDKDCNSEDNYDNDIYYEGKK